jgi:hypothetical protein
MQNFFLLYLSTLLVGHPSATDTGAVINIYLLLVLCDYQ